MGQPSASESQLAPFIEAAKAKGASDESLVRLLGQRGWAEKKVYEVLGKFYEQATGMSIPGRTGGSGENAKDAFLYLLSFSTLGVWTIALGSLVFNVLEEWFPDAVTARPYYDPSWAISSNLAAVMVAFPVYLLLMRFILGSLAAHPEKQESGVRKWLTYIALFIAAGIVVGDLITFLAYLLRGGLTVRFMLKVATVLVLAGGVFWYYLTSLRHRIFATAATALVAAGLVIGFLNLGSPSAQRQAAADRARVQDLRNVAWEINTHWRKNPPPSLWEATSAPGARRLQLNDPLTRQPYEYRVREGTVYELCATFDTDSHKPDGRPSFWNHPKGRYCYALDAGRPPQD